MRTWFKIVFDTLKVFILFTGSTLLFYYALMWVNQEYEYYHRYDQPEGRAVKVANLEEEGSTLVDRLFFFYRNGE